MAKCGPNNPCHGMQNGLFNPFFGLTDITYRVDITGRTTITAFGDSITVGQGASPSSFSYLNQYRITKGLALTSQAAAGKGVWNQVSSIQTQGWTAAVNLVSCMIGLNDMKRNGANQKTVNKILTGHRAIAFKVIRGTTAYANGGSVVMAGGSFTSYNAASVGGTGTGTLARSTSILNATYTYNFSGTGIGVQLIGADGSLYNHGTCDILIDGVVVQQVVLNDWYDGVSDGTYDNGRGPVVFMFSGLANTSHTIVVKNTSALPVPLDFFSVLNSPANVSAMLFFEIPYCTDDGYAQVPNFGSIAASDICSNQILSVVSFLSTLGYNVGYVKTNSVYNPVNSTDGTHPNNTGHTQIFNAALAVTLP